MNIKISKITMKDGHGYFIYLHVKCQQKLQKINYAELIKQNLTIVGINLLGEIFAFSLEFETAPAVPPQFVPKHLFRHCVDPERDSTAQH